MCRGITGSMLFNKRLPQSQKVAMRAGCGKPSIRHHLSVIRRARRARLSYDRPEPYRLANPAMAVMATTEAPRLDPKKFRDPFVTAAGERRAQVALRALDTLWFNTGTLCNLTCQHCYIESSPKNDRLVYLSAAEAGEYLDEIERLGLGTRLIGFTGGEPFMNPALPAMLDLTLARGFRALVLTNAMKPMHKMKPALLALHRRHGERLAVRVSLDHYGRGVHEAERRRRSWQPTIDGLLWLAAGGFAVSVASRRLSGETEAEIRRGFAGLFAELGLALDADDPLALTVFPEMDPAADVPE